MASQIDHHFDLTNQYFIKLFNIGLYIRTWLVHILEYSHLLLDDFNTLLATRIMLEY
jgi:hypothetical protein